MIINTSDGFCLDIDNSKLRSKLLQDMTEENDEENSTPIPILYAKDLLEDLLNKVYILSDDPKLTKTMTNEDIGQILNFIDYLSIDHLIPKIIENIVVEKDILGILFEHFNTLNFHNIAKNPILTLDYAEKYARPSSGPPLSYLCWFSLSGNPNLTLEFVKKYEDKEWEWWRVNGLSQAPNFTIEWVERMSIRPESWGWDLISVHKNFKPEWVDKFPDMEWDWDNILGMSNSESFDIECIKKWPEKDWNFGKFGLSSNKNFKIEWVNVWPDAEWYWGSSGISQSRNFKIEWINMWPTKPWCWGQEGISSVPNFKIEWVKMYPDAGWFWGTEVEVQFLNMFDSISSSPNFQLEWFFMYQDKPWQWGSRGISASRNFKIEWVVDHPELPWDIDVIQERTDFKIEWIDICPSLEIENPSEFMLQENFRIEWLELRPEWLNIWLSSDKYMDHVNLTTDWFKKYPNRKWDRRLLSKKKYEKERREHIDKILENFKPIVNRNIYSLFEKEANKKYLTYDVNY